MVDRFLSILYNTILGLVVFVKAEIEEKHHHHIHHKQAMIDNLRSKLDRCQVNDYQ